MECGEVNFENPLPPVAQVAPLETVDECKEFISAITLALFDYLRKSRSKGFVLSLSGGADSSACAVAVAEMVKRAFDELGLDVFARKLNLFSAEDLQKLEFLNDFEKQQFLTGKLLTTCLPGLPEFFRRYVSDCRRTGQIYWRGIFITGPSMMK